MKSILPPVLLLLILAACRNTAKDEKEIVPAAAVPAVMTYTITNVYPHNTGSFTEGLEWHDGFLYEGTGDPDHKNTGKPGKSKLAKIDLSTGKDVQQLYLTDDYFGEGITILNGKIYQLTWQEGKCFVYDYKTFKKIGEFTYKGEGWGMTNDGKYLIMNNSGDKLVYRDPVTFQIVKELGVTDNNGPLASINELEYVDGFIYSNVYLTNKIVKIDPSNGKVVAQADFSFVLNKYAPGLVSDEEQKSSAVLNGIAYDSVGKRFFVTGKLWPKLFEVKFN